jgi:hypothetical protein
MKVLINNYVFDSSLKRVTFSDYSSIDLEGVLLITNVSINEIIYNFAEPTKGGTISGNQLTLTYDTTAMSGSDKLQIFYENGENAASDVTSQAILDGLATLRRMAKNMESLQVVDAAQRQRVAIEVIPGVNVGSISTLNTLGGVPTFYQLVDWARASYNTSIRPKLIF